MFLNPDENLDLLSSSCHMSIELDDKGHSSLISICIDGNILWLQDYITKYDKHTLQQHINFRAQNGKTALYVSCSQGYSDIVRMLLEHGADPNISLNDGTTPLMIACQKNHQGCIYHLLNNIDIKIDINAIRNTGVTALMIAAMNGHLTISEMLISHGANVNLKSQNGFTALAYGCYSKSSSILLIKLLIRNGSDINWRKPIGQNLVSICRYTDVHNYLISLGLKDEDRCIIL